MNRPHGVALAIIPAHLGPSTVGKLDQGAVAARVRKREGLFFPDGLTWSFDALPDDAPRARHNDFPGTTGVSGYSMRHSRSFPLTLAWCQR
jgi:hypothetical protein